jgi:hypothetical protein
MNPAVVVSLGCGLAAAIAVYLALWLDHPPREPLVPLAVAVVAGGALGPAALAAAERLASAPVRGAAALTVLVPLGAVLLVLAAFRAVAGPLDGALVGTAGGAVAGAGAVVWLVRSGHPPAVIDVLAIVFGCAAATAVFGAGAGRARLAGRSTTGAAWLAAGVLGAGATAAPWLAWLADVPVDARALDAARLTVPLLALVAVLLLAGHFERRVLERELGEEVANGILPGEIVVVVAAYPRRIRSAWWPRGDERRALVGLLRRLAFRKQQLRHLEGDRLHLAGLEVGRVRDRVRRLFDPREVEALAREFVG